MHRWGRGDWDCSGLARHSRGGQHIAGSAGRSLRPRKGPGCGAERSWRTGSGREEEGEVGGLQKAGRASDGNGGKTAELSSKNLCPPWGNGRRN